MSDSEIAPPNARRAFTVGHSTHTLERLAGLLRARRVGRIVDVRRFPGSRRMPHFSADALARELPEQGIEYVHVGELGGFRRPARDSPNGGWEHSSFRGYADYMRTPEFAAALDGLIELALERPTATMCAEALWQRCHRRLISDALIVRGFEVLHIGSDGRLTRHQLTPFARVEDGELAYPPAQGALDL